MSDKKRADLALDLLDNHLRTEQLFEEDAKVSKINAAIADYLIYKGMEGIEDLDKIFGPIMTYTCSERGRIIKEILKKPVN